MKASSLIHFKNALFKWKINSLILFRSCSKLNYPKVEGRPHPFKKRFRKQPIKVENDSRIAIRICITIIGNGGIGQPRCVGLFTEFKGYLFNCGEGVGRYCQEYDIDSCLIKHVFVTQRKWENISGFPDIYVSNQMQGLYYMNLYGPPGIELYTSIITSSKVHDTNLVKKAEANYIDHTLNIQHVPILPQHAKLSSTKSSCNKKFSKEDHLDVVYCYICEIFEKPGDFLVEKCVEYGVPVGPLLLKLKNGENIELPGGKNVYAKDVHGTFYPGGVILVVDCPSEAYIESLINEKRFEAYQLPLNTSTEVFSIFHFTPSHVFNSSKYQNWLKKFHQSTQHYALNSDCPVTSSKAVHQMQKYFNLLHPQIFSNLRDTELVPTEKELGNGNNLIYPPPILQIYIRPEKKLEKFNIVSNDPDSANVAVDGTDIVIWSPEINDKVKSLHSAFKQKLTLNTHLSKGYPEVVFLGTSSSTCTAYRNVSAILVNTSPESSILLDCGESTVMQFSRFYGPDLNAALRKISCVFISHLHLDHYLGVFELVSQRLKAFKNSFMSYKPLILILPNVITSVFQEFCNIFENLHPAVKIHRCKYLGLNKLTLNDDQYRQNIQIFTVPVVHCPDAHGIILELGSKWKIVYSGDTAPSQKLIDAGKDCTLLIHEASIDDFLLSEAVSKTHCTPTQVIEVAEKMNAKYTIMTHFSKRYLPVPITPECSSREVGYAYDFMKVRMCDLPLVPLFTPVIKSLFKDRLNTNIENSTNTFSTENVFLKVLKS